MERKTKHRILGILVVIGLVIILLPFFQSGKEPSSEATVLKAPPFPDQSVQVTSTESAQPAESTVNQQPDDIITALHPSIVNAQPPEIIKPEHAIARATETVTPDTTKAPSDKKGKVAELAPSIDVSHDVSHQTPKVKKAAHLIKHSHDIKMQTASFVRKPFVRKPIDNNGLFKLKNAAWVIQMGSFKNKANALRLVNQLRASGYNAFIQEVTQSTQVFVGPESKQASARALAGQLESHMHLRGIVISYQPLTL